MRGILGAVPVSECRVECRVSSVECRALHIVEVEMGPACAPSATDDEVSCLTAFGSHVTFLAFGFVVRRTIFVGI